MSAGFDAATYRKLASTLPPVPEPICGNCQFWNGLSDYRAVVVPMDGFRFGSCNRFACETIKHHDYHCGEHELRSN